MIDALKLLAVAACSAMLTSAPHGAEGHGRLTSPEPRDVVGTGLASYESNNPVSGHLGQDFKCRNFDNAGPSKATLVAGGTSTVTTGMTAAHVGDCSLYISYDSNKWFKIANFFDCKANNYNPTSFSVPAWLPAGNAVMRWEWVALHVWPNVEFYTQCVDVTITRTSGTGQMPNANDMFAIPGHLPAPGSNYRNPWGSGDTHIVGPAVASSPSTAPPPPATTTTTTTTTTSTSSTISSSTTSSSTSSGSGPAGTTTTTTTTTNLPEPSCGAPNETCADRGYDCGSFFTTCSADGSLLLMECGSCPVGMCKNNRCECSPRAPDDICAVDSAGQQPCGMHDDSCNTQISCPDCKNGTVCLTSGYCSSEVVCGPNKILQGGACVCRRGTVLPYCLPANSETLASNGHVLSNSFDIISVVIGVAVLLATL